MKRISPILIALMFALALPLGIEAATQSDPQWSRSPNDRAANLEVENKKLQSRLDAATKTIEKQKAEIEILQEQVAALKAQLHH